MHPHEADDRGRRTKSAKSAWGGRPQTWPEAELGCGPKTGSRSRPASENAAPPHSAGRGGPLVRRVRRLRPTFGRTTPLLPSGTFCCPPCSTLRRRLGEVTPCTHPTNVAGIGADCAASNTSHSRSHSIHWPGRGRATWPSQRIPCCATEVPRIPSCWLARRCYPPLTQRCPVQRAGGRITPRHATP